MEYTQEAGAYPNYELSIYQKNGDCAGFDLMTKGPVNLVINLYFNAATASSEETIIIQLKIIKETFQTNEKIYLHIDPQQNQQIEKLVPIHLANFENIKVIPDNPIFYFREEDELCPILPTERDGKIEYFRLKNFYIKSSPPIDDSNTFLLCMKDIIDWIVKKCAKRIMIIPIHIRTEDYPLAASLSADLRGKGVDVFLATSENRPPEGASPLPSTADSRE